MCVVIGFGGDISEIMIGAGDADGAGGDDGAGIGDSGADGVDAGIERESKENESIATFKSNMTYLQTLSAPSLLGFFIKSAVFSRFHRHQQTL